MTVAPVLQLSRRLRAIGAALSLSIVSFFPAQCAPPLPPTGVGSCYPVTLQYTAIWRCSAAPANGFQYFRADATWEVYSTWAWVPTFRLVTSGPWVDPPDNMYNECCSQTSMVESQAPPPDLTYIGSQGYNAVRLIGNDLVLL